MANRSGAATTRRNQCYDIYKTVHADEDDVQPPDIVEMHFDSRADAAKWMLQNQDGKRNLTSFQRTEAALKVEAMFAVQAKANQQAGGNTSEVGRQNSAQPIKTRNEVAKLAGVSHDTVSKVKAILEEAEPELVDQVRSGEARRSSVSPNSSPCHTTPSTAGWPASIRIRWKLAMLPC